MKKIIKTLIIILIASLLSLNYSCKEDFIDLNPISNASANTFYQKQSDFETAIFGVYSEWTSLFNTLWTSYTEFRGDTYINFLGATYEISHNIFELNTTASPWNLLYRIISYSNTILDRIDNVDFTNESVKVRIKAEARFFRAEAYFALVRFFGAVPLVEHEITSVEAFETGRTGVETIFNLIEEDYKFAADNLPASVVSSEYGRITKYAAEGQLARVYITLSGKMYNQNRWADAKPLLEDILLNSPYAFSNTYQEIFAPDGSNEMGEEIILSALFKAGTEGFGSGYAASFTIHHTNLFRLIEDGVYESYEDGDLRRDVNLVWGFYLRPYYTTYFDVPANRKFAMLFDPVAGNSGMNFPILRYTDVYLLYAETLAEIAGNVPAQSLEILNKVRNRAGLPSLTEANVPDLASFRIAMEKERRSELMFECVRWFDLVRTGRAVEALNAVGKNADETWLLYPIPQTEIDKVGEDLLPQNPGY